MTDTFPHRLIENAEKFANRPAIREKDLGIWQTWTWLQMKQEIFSFANGLAALGFQRGDKLAIIGGNRPRLYWGICAAQCLGGIPVPIYADSVAEEMEYVLNHAGVSYVLAEDQEQVDKALEVIQRCESLKHIIFDDSRGLRDYDKTSLHDFDLIQKQGEEFAAANPDFLKTEIDKCRGEDIGIFLYTSGTTGKPKGVVLTNNNVLITSINSAKMDKLTEHEEMLSYLPLAWVGRPHFFLWSGLCNGNVH